ncbi:hypothetical protein SKAU_G00014040 [Synaphobranchus kaupii]|uniref:Uncharacterized protein n=1 Tax=Synaphobranchus kaupii TaxID=118154 RepID=A0A9Q1GAK0_SYNKA|nr:hypothetical protein SKAU_G00014040 [Synaphobranchus kaupii]
MLPRAVPLPSEIPPAAPRPSPPTGQGNSCTPMRRVSPCSRVTSQRVWRAAGQRRCLEFADVECLVKRRECLAKDGARAVPCGLLGRRASRCTAPCGRQANPSVTPITHTASDKRKGHISPDVPGLCETWAIAGQRRTAALWDTGRAPARRPPNANLRVYRRRFTLSIILQGTPTAWDTVSGRSYLEREVTIGPALGVLTPVISDEKLSDWSGD